MTKFSAFCLTILAVGSGLASCNSSSEQLEYEPPTTALVKGFSLSEDSKVLDNLDKVFFSIDLANARIFNADSMPYGTKTNKLVPVITTGGASAVELVVPRAGQSDTTYNYLTNSTDSIDFSSGPVKLKIQALDESVTMVYTINVNVHQVKSDSLTWGTMALSKLPTNLNYIKAQHTVKHKGTVYCLTTDGAGYCMAASANPTTEQWQTKTVTFGFTPDIESLRASSEAMYMLDEGGAMYKSTDCGDTWAATGDKFDYLIGGYGKDVIGTVNDNGQWSIVTTSGVKCDAPAGFPVTGTSNTVEYTFPMSDSRMLTIVGGRQADGALSRAAWGFDGSNWACLSSQAFAEGMEGMSLVPYYVFEENEYWVATKESVFLAFGGLTESNVDSKTVYISYDYGVTWRKAGESLQMKKGPAVTAFSQAIVVSSLLGSRASVAITSWECPYIYMFGGHASNGDVYNAVWRGVINRLSFKPLQ